MGIFDKEEKKSSVDISFPEPVKEDMAPAFSEPPKEVGKMETSFQESPSVSQKPIDEPKIPEPTMPTTISPTLYIKLSEYKEVVESTNKMRKDIEKAKNIVGDLRLLEKEESSKLEKSKELIQEIDKVISLFEKTMITPLE